MAELSQLHLDFLASSKAVRALHLGKHGLLLESADVGRPGVQHSGKPVQRTTVGR